MTFATLIFGFLTFALLLMVLGWASDLFQALHRNTAGPHHPGHLDRGHEHGQSEVFYARGRSGHGSWAER
jgi:hypothetical protein